MENKQMRGFSLLEMALVIAIAGVMMAVTFLALEPALKDARVTEALNTVVQQLRIARAQAIDRREQYIVCFGTATPSGAATPLGKPNAQSISIYQWASGTALSSATQVTEVQLPTDMQFQVVSGIPTGANTVPDGFGTGSVALDFDQGVASGTKTQVMFMPDGSARDTNNYLNSGVLYLARSGQLYSSRAVTVYAGSGRVRAFRLVNQGGSAKWIEQ
jgi:prepilin-type N-terminal cleavage/methylation domain-containing protein